MVTDPLREVWVGATLSLTVPLPVPLAPDATVIQLTELAALQAHPDAAVTLTVTSPPAATTFWLWGAMVLEQPADCDTVICVPATEIVPVRAAPLTGATLNATFPFPAPDVVPVRVIQGTSVVAFHPQLGPPETADDPVPPCAPNVWVSGSTEIEQPLVWVIASACPAISTEPEREAPLVGSTTIRTVPGPVPEAPSTTAAQGTVLAAVQGHPTPAVTVTVVCPPAAPGEKLDGAIAKLQPWGGDWDGDCVTE
jgi:hypothetical protein